MWEIRWGQEYFDIIPTFCQRGDFAVGGIGRAQYDLCLEFLRIEEEDALQDDPGQTPRIASSHGHENAGLFGRVLLWRSSLEDLPSQHRVVGTQERGSVRGADKVRFREPWARVQQGGNRIVVQSYRVVNDEERAPGGVDCTQLGLVEMIPVYHDPAVSGRKCGDEVGFSDDVAQFDPFQAVPFCQPVRESFCHQCNPAALSLPGLGERVASN